MEQGEKCTTSEDVGDIRIMGGKGRTEGENRRSLTEQWGTGAGRSLRYDTKGNFVFAWISDATGDYSGGEGKKKSRDNGANFKKSRRDARKDF